MTIFKGMLLPILILFVIALVKPLPGRAADETAPLAPGDYQVRIADPFIELHTGPGSAFPIFHVVDRGDLVIIRNRRTDWFRLETADGKSGWASREQMRKTLLPGGEAFRLVNLDEDDFAGRSWMIGVTAGELVSAPVFTLFGARSMTENLAIELHVGQSVGSRSSSSILKGNLVLQPMPDWRYAPFMTLGLGSIDVDPGATLIVSDSDQNNLVQFGLGVQHYLSRRFLVRFEVNEYVIFSSSTGNDDNEEANEWKLGFAVFF